VLGRRQDHRGNQPALRIVQARRHRAAWPAVISARAVGVGHPYRTLAPSALDKKKKKRISMSEFALSSRSRTISMCQQSESRSEPEASAHRVSAR